VFNHKLNLDENYLQTAKQVVAPNGESISFLQRMGLAGMAGAVGGFVGTPGDMVNIHKIFFFFERLKF
jgi:hypothetical protein